MARRKLTLADALAMKASAGHGEATAGKRAPRRHEEDDIQSGVVDWFGVIWPRFRRLIHHSPNEDAYKHAQRAAALGMQKGFPDLFVAVPRGVYHGLFVEMKTAEGTASPEQREMLALLSGQGYACAIAHGQSTARAYITRYMELKEGETL